MESGVHIRGQNMATIVTQRDLVVALKRETILTIGILSKLRPMSVELNNLLKENALEKPAQNLFYHLSQYLVLIIDNQLGCGLSWPLYDIKTEKAFRNGLSKFINVYSSKGLLSPVMSSYLVNPGSYKIILLVFQMSQLALQKTLLSKMHRESQKKLYDDMTKNYKTQDKENFMKNIEKETTVLFSKFSHYISKKEKIVKIAAVMCNRIKEMEDKLASLEAQKYINELVDGFIKKYEVDNLTKKEILNIKNVSKPSMFIEAWLSNVDEKIVQLETEWSRKMCPFLTLASTTENCTEILIGRLTGKAEKSTYMLEYNPKTDNICTKELQNQVNSEQKYILKNIVKNNQLSFPNLVRGFLVAVSFIQKDAELGSEIYKFNEYLDGGRRNLSEMVNAVRILLDRVTIIETKLQSTPRICNQFTSPRTYSEIPLLPDLSDLKMGKDLQSQTYDSFTPLNISKYQFNLRRKTNTVFTKPQSRSMLITPLYQGPRDDFLKGLISCRVSSYDQPNTTQNFNMSVYSQTNLRNNETIAECSSGFTQQQILRLLSTKKSSSSKKFKYKLERPNNAINIKKGGLFNESHTSTDSNGLYRSYSSPNLYEHREKKSKVGRKLSIMQEACPLLEVSGILALEKDGSYSTPEGVRLANSRKIFNEPSLPVITSGLDNINTIDVKKKSPMVGFADVNLSKLKETALDAAESKTETPKNNTQLIRKTNSLEKIINRFKKVRASVLPDSEKEDEFKTIVEEKNINADTDVFNANRILLPDLLSPSYSVISKKSLDYLDPILDVDEIVTRRPRESLGTALGVDNTFLDQFDLID